MSQTHFGYQQVPEEHKAHKVAEVFHSVAAKYDVMNDLMSAGLQVVEDVHDYSGSYSAWL